MYSIDCNDFPFESHKDIELLENMPAGGSYLFVRGAKKSVTVDGVCSTIALLSAYINLTSWNLSDLHIVSSTIHCDRKVWSHGGCYSLDSPGGLLITKPQIPERIEKKKNTRNLPILLISGKKIKYPSSAHRDKTLGKSKQRGPRYQRQHGTWKKGVSYKISASAACGVIR